MVWAMDKRLPEVNSETRLCLMTLGTLETYWSWKEHRLALMILSAALIEPSVSVSPVIPLDICREPTGMAAE